MHSAIPTTDNFVYRIGLADGAYLSEGVGVRNIAATTTAKKGFYLDEFAFRLDLPGSRTGFTFT